jgi:hypothetical protein
MHDGFNTYGICPFCSWEDCAFQLGNPLDVGGPNGECLVDHQARAMRDYPPDVREARAADMTFTRDPRWRPLTPAEIAFHEAATEAFPAVFDLKDAYWIRAGA